MLVLASCNLLQRTLTTSSAAQFKGFVTHPHAMLAGIHGRKIEFAWAIDGAGEPCGFVLLPNDGTT
jgi:hypothetical protein